MLKNIFAKKKNLSSTYVEPSDSKVVNGLTDLAKTRLPHHVAIIMDGNGRWAKEKKLSRSAGHELGAKTLKRIAQVASNIGIKVLTVYAFSTENWKRPTAEVDFIMKLFSSYLKKEIQELHGDNIKMSFIGRRDKLSKTLLKQMVFTEELTKNNTGLHFQVALNYGGQDEIIRAVQKLASKVIDGDVTPNDIDSTLIEEHLDTAGEPPVDLLIRTSGDFRTSNFLIWQTAYAELWFTETKWPDFSEEELYKALNDFATRERRFGGL